MSQSMRSVREGLEKLTAVSKLEIVLTLLDGLVSNPAALNGEHLIGTSLNVQHIATIAEFGKDVLEYIKALPEPSAFDIGAVVDKLSSADLALGFVMKPYPNSAAMSKHVGDARLYLRDAKEMLQPPSEPSDADAKPPQPVIRGVEAGVPYREYSENQGPHFEGSWGIVWVYQPREGSAGMYRYVPESMASASSPTPDAVNVTSSGGIRATPTGGQMYIDTPDGEVKVDAKTFKEAWRRNNPPDEKLAEKPAYPRDMRDQMREWMDRTESDLPPAREVLPPAYPLPEGARVSLEPGAVVIRIPIVGSPKIPDAFFKRRT